MAISRLLFFIKHLDSYSVRFWYSECAGVCLLRHKAACHFSTVLSAVLNMLSFFTVIFVCATTSNNFKTQPAAYHCVLKCQNYCFSPTFTQCFLMHNIIPSSKNLSITSDKCATEWAIIIFFLFILLHIVCFHHIFSNPKNVVVSATIIFIPHSPLCVDRSNLFLEAFQSSRAVVCERLSVWLTYVSWHKHRFRFDSYWTPADCLFLSFSFFLALRASFFLWLC